MSESAYVQRPDARGCDECYARAGRNEVSYRSLGAERLRNMSLNATVGRLELNSNPQGSERAHEPDHSANDVHRRDDESPVHPHTIDASSETPQGPHYLPRSAQVSVARGESVRARRKAEDFSDWLSRSTHNERGWHHLRVEGDGGGELLTIGARACPCAVPGRALPVVCTDRVLDGLANPNVGVPDPKVCGHNGLAFREGTRTRAASRQRGGEGEREAHGEDAFHPRTVLCTVPVVCPSIGVAA